MSAQSTPSIPTDYPARLEVDYTVEHNRVTTLFRVVLVIPIAIVYGALTAGATTHGLRRERPDRDHDQRGHRGRAVPGHAPDDPLPAALPALVVRLRTRAHPVRRPHRRLRRATHRRVPLDGRGAEGPSRHRLPRRRAGPEPLAATRQVVPRDPALHRAALLVDRRLRRGRHRLVRDPVHRPLSARACSTSSSVSAAGHCASTPTHSCSSPTNTLRSRSAESQAATRRLR